MTTITLHLPDNAPLSVLFRMADEIGCFLRLLPDGSYAAVPRHDTNVVKFPAERRQERVRMHRTDGGHGDGPEAA